MRERLFIPLADIAPCGHRAVPRSHKLKRQFSLAMISAAIQMHARGCWCSSECAASKDDRDGTRIKVLGAVQL